MPEAKTLPANARQGLELEARGGDGCLIMKATAMTPLFNPLLVPAMRTEWVAKAFAAGADAVIPVLEHPFAPSDKTNARNAGCVFGGSVRLWWKDVHPSCPETAGA